MNFPKKKILLFLSMALFLSLFAAGIRLAERRPVDNDEFYTAVSSVNRLSHINIFKGKVSEGNNSPLFYSSQKALWSSLGYRIPEDWPKGHWVDHAADRFYLRLNSVFCMSLMIAVIFFFLANFYSLWAGVFSLFLSMSSTMVWFYWTQGRPYAMWMLLTAVQLLVFLYFNLLRDERSPSAHPLIQSKRFSGPWTLLTIVNLLLSLTSIFALAQVAIISFLLWIFFERRWQRYWLLTVVPCLISGFYYIQSPKYNWWFSLTPDQLLRECLSRDRFYVIGIYVLCLILSWVKSKFPSAGFLPDIRSLKGRVLAVAAGLMILAGAAVLFAFKVIESRNPAHAGFSVSSRYFVFLTAMGIITTAFFSFESVRGLKNNRCLQWLTAGGIGYLVIHRAWKLLPVIQGIYHW